MPAAACASPRSAVYRRRQPRRTLLYRTVQTHLATWLALQNDGAGASEPAVTKRELGRYLDCGILAHGFARARCAACGHELTPGGRPLLSKSNAGIIGRPYFAATFSPGTNTLSGLPGAE